MVPFCRIALPRSHVNVTELCAIAVYCANACMRCIAGQNLFIFRIPKSSLETFLEVPTASQEPGGKAEERDVLQSFWRPTVCHKEGLPHTVQAQIQCKGPECAIAIELLDCKAPPAREPITSRQDFHQTATPQALSIASVANLQARGSFCAMRMRSHCFLSKRQLQVL